MPGRATPRDADPFCAARPPLLACGPPPGIFGLLQLIAFMEYIRTQLNSQQFNLLFRAVVVRHGMASGRAPG